MVAPVASASHLGLARTSNFLFNCNINCNLIYWRPFTTGPMATSIARVVRSLNNVVGS